MAKVTVDISRCKGCGLCVSVCPKKILGIDSKTHTEKGYYPAVCIDPENCIGCAQCYAMCPDYAITVEK